LELINRRGFIRAYQNNGIECAKLTIPTHGIIIVPTWSVIAIKLRIFPFALSLSKGEWKNSSPEVKPFMLRLFGKLTAQHERLNLMALTQSVGTIK
jgi:hypothetical protein